MRSTEVTVNKNNGSYNQHMHVIPQTGPTRPIDHNWLVQQNINSEWLFPSTAHPDRHITEKQFYKVMARVGDLLGINYLGTHTMRKTGAYRVYTQSNYNIGLVMHLLNHSSESMTLTYLGLDQASRETMLDQIDFG